MKLTRIPPFYRFLIIPLLISGSAFAVTPITITNPGFELPAVAEENPTYSDIPVGWSAYNGASLGSTVYAYNPSIDDFDSEAPEGDNVAGVLTLLAGGVEKGLSQTLSTTFKEGDVYQLTVKVGYTNYYEVDPGYKVQLLAGGTVIAEDNNSLNPAFGEFATSTLNYVYDPADSGLVNQALQIRLINKGLDDFENEVAFDDVQLSVVLANPEVNAGGPYYLPNPTTSLSLVATALPSGNATITAYEWDLDNDGQFDDATGATPAAISFTDLQSVYGMVDGSNTIRLRVTDSSSKTAIDQATVELVSSTKYTGISSSNDTWSTTSNWDNGVPQGDLDVVILAGKGPRAWGNATPIYTGNLTLQNNAYLGIGYTTTFQGSYNALGTPGTTKITMNAGSSISTSTGGTPVIPEIQLRGNALFVLGSSTGPGADAKFNYPISGAYQLYLQGNSQSGNLANFNVPNTFNEIYAAGAPYVDGGLTIKGNAAGSLGIGNVTIAKNRSTTASYAILEINAANAMADTGTLSITGTTGTMLRMNANDTIAAFIFNGVQQPAGTYGSTTSSATYKYSWITGSGILTVGTPAVGYWDLNGSSAGAGGSSPSATWDAANAYWNNLSDGSGTAAAWTAGNTAIFSAGSDATGSYTVDVVGNQDISGLTIRNGSVALNQGSGGNLRLTANGTISVGSGSSSVGTPITQDASARSLSISNVGALTLSGDLSHTGVTTLNGGTLVLSGNNSLASGGTTVNAGVLTVNTASSIPGSTRNVTLNASGTLSFDTSFGSSNIQTALNNRIVTNSSGTLVANNHASTSFDFNTAGLTAAYFGSLGDLNYTGTLTPQGTAYRLSGEGGTLTMANANAITGARSLTVRGSVILAANNNFTGATSVLANASLSLPGTTTTSGITLNANSTLTIGNNGSLGSGTLTLAGLATLKAVGTLVTTNAVAANSDFIIAGTGNLTLGTTTISANRIITNISSGTTTFTSIVNGASNLSLTIEGSGNTTLSGNLTLPNGNLTKNGSGTLTLNGSNTYNITTLNGGVLVLNGTTSGAGTTNILAAGLQLGNASNGGLPTGNITISNAAAFIQAVGADRSITNNLILDNNLTLSGSQSLTINGKLTHNNANRTLTNSIATGKTLTLGDVDLSQNTTSRIMTFAGSGKTVVNGIIANGGGSTAGALVKSGTGNLILNGTNTYAGTTTVNANSGEVFINGSTGASNITVNGGSNLYIYGSTGTGNITMNSTSKLFVYGSTGSGNITINNGATLLGTGIIGGNTTIAAGGKLAFNLNSSPASHDKLELGASRSLTFSGSSQVTVTGFASTGTYTLLTAPGGISGSVPSLVYPDGWVAGLSIVGNNLVLTVEYSGVFPNPPTLVSIADDKSGGSVDVYTPITYTVTFSEDMNDNTVSSADFGNAGTASVQFGDITETAPGVFTFQVIPNSAGTLQLRINAGASLQSTAGLNLNTTNALLDDNTLTVTVPVHGVLAVTSGDFSTIGDPGGPFSPTSKTYTLNNYGSQSLDWSATKSVAWLNLSSSGGTLAPGASTTVTVTPNSNANSLTVGSYFDTVTFANTTSGAGNGLGNTTRGVSLTVNGLPVVVTLGNLYQTYDGTPKAVSVTTSPQKTYSLTYNGLSGAENVPIDAGSYDVVATVTESGYTGSASGTLLISKASQTINFATLNPNPVGNDQSSITLTATSTSNLPVTFTSSDSAVATVDGNTVTIVGIGSTTITASQVGDENYHPADNVEQVLTVIRTNPLAVPGGPYTVSTTADLALDGSGSLASNNATISSYEWDLDDGNDGGGAFTANVTGATPSTLTMAVLQSTYGMVSGSNTIRLRVTDSAGKTSTVSTTVLVTAPLRWDADANYANGQTDGSGGWLSANQWRDVAISQNTSWTSGKDAIFGNGGAGGSVALPAPTSVGSMTFNTFTGTYNIGSAYELTVNRGMTKNAGDVTFSCPIILDANQTWTNPSGTVTIPGKLDLGSNTLTIENVGQVTISGSAVGASAMGTGGIIKNGTGLLRLANDGAPKYTGPTVINAGRLMIGNGGALPPGNLTLNNAILQAYYTFGLTRTLGPGAGQVQLTGGTTGFSSITSIGAGVTLNNSANYEVVWGSQYFSPSTFVMENGDRYDLSFNNKIDLNGSTRTVSTPLGAGVTTPGTATFSGIIRNSSTTPAGLIKSGAGILRLNAANTYNGGTTLQEGTLQLGNLTGLGSSVGTLTVNGGLLNLNNIAAVTVGNLTGTGGTIANNGAGAITFTIGNGGATGGNFQGVIANNTNAGTGTLALTKTGTGSITLSGTNTYTGATSINQGKLFINGSTGASNITVASGATLGGNGTLGGNATIAANGKLEFTLNTAAGSHNPLDFATGKGLTFSGASELTVSMSTGAAPGTYVLVTGGNNISGIAPATLRLPLGCIANLSIVGNQLLLVVTETGDITPPTLAANSIVDDKSGSQVTTDTLVTYTVTFSEDMDASTVAADDFGNAGTSIVNIGTVTETSPGVFSVPVTPTSAGTLQLRVNASAVLTDVGGNALNTTSAIADDTTITVINRDTTPPTLAGSAIVDNKSGSPIMVNTLVTYAVTFSEEMNASTVAAADFGNAGTATVSIGSVTETSPGVFSVPVTPTSAGTLQLKVNASAVLTDVAGNALDTTSAIADDTTITVDGTPPTLAGSAIVDNKSGGPVMVNTLVTYTVTFSEDMDASTVAAADFGNAGTSSVSIGTVTETSPGVFSLPVTPTSAGTLQLKVNASAILTDVAGNALNTTSAISDDTTITVDNTLPTLAGSSIVDDKSGGSIAVNTLVTYTVTFSEDMDASTVTAADFGNAGTATVSIGSVTETSPGVFSVPVTPTSAGTLQLKVNASAVLTDVAGNALNTTSAIADDTTITVDNTLPTLAGSSFVDDKSGGSIAVNTLVTYTVTFSEDMDASTVAAADFGNAGTATVSIGSVTETSPGVFSVPVTPTSIGTLQLKVNASAVLTDVAGNALNTTSAIADDTTIIIQSVFEYWSGGAASNADANSDGVSNAMAWLLGATNTSTNAINLLPTFDNSSDATYFIYTYRRSDLVNTSPGTVITVEYGTSLANWTTASHDGTNIVISTTDDFYGTGVDRVQVKIARSLATNGKLFTRIKLVP
jgi:autotransporter-associated beta strand protein